MGDLYRRTGCQVRGLIEIMRDDQREHITGGQPYPETYGRFRTAVLEWMLEVCEYFQLHATTSHAAAAYLDRLQPNEKFTQKEWQLLAVCCIIISAKYNECEEHVPDLYTLEEITKQSLPNETILNYELWILKKMGWKLNARTTMAFLACFFTQSALVLPHEKSLTEPAFTAEELATQLRRQVEELAVLALLDPAFKSAKRSEVAAASVLAARQRLAIRPLWSAHLTDLTGYAPADLIDLSNALLGAQGAPFPAISVLIPAAGQEGFYAAASNNNSNTNYSSSNSNSSSRELLADAESLSLEQLGIVGPLQSPTSRGKLSAPGASPTSIAADMENASSSANQSNKQTNK